MGEPFPFMTAFYQTSHWPTPAARGPAPAPLALPPAGPWRRMQVQIGCNLAEDLSRGQNCRAN